MSTFFFQKFDDNAQQCFAFTPQANEGDGIESRYVAWIQSKGTIQSGLGVLPSGNFFLDFNRSPHFLV